LRSAGGRTEPFSDPIELPAGVVEAGFSASSNGRQLVFVGRKPEVDLMLIEGFH